MFKLSARATLAHTTPHTAGNRDPAESSWGNNNALTHSTAWYNVMQGSVVW
jgi:hypothetical protein